MSNKILKYLFFAYHTVFYSPLRTCRFEPTCSRYALDAFEKYGLIKGGWLATKRILSCHPFTKRPIYDPT